MSIGRMGIDVKIRMMFKGRFSGCFKVVAYGITQVLPLILLIMSWTCHQGEDKEGDEGGDSVDKL